MHFRFSRPAIGACARRRAASSATATRPDQCPISATTAPANVSASRASAATSANVACQDTSVGRSEDVEVSCPFVSPGGSILSSSNHPRKCVHFRMRKMRPTGPPVRSKDGRVRVSAEHERRSVPALQAPHVRLRQAQGMQGMRLRPARVGRRPMRPQLRRVQVSGRRRGREV